MNGSQEHPDVPTQRPTRPVAPPPAPPVQTAPPQPAASCAVPATAAGRAQRLQHKSPFIACALSLLPGLGQVYVGYYKLGFIHNVVFASTIMLLTTDLPDAMYPLLGIFLAFSSSSTSSTRAGGLSITTSPSTGWRGSSCRA